MREKGDESAQLRGELYNQTTLTRLAGVLDIYKTFGSLVNISQEYRLLPHQRLDKARNLLEDWKKMTDHIEDEGCTGKENSCRMKHFHTSVCSLKTDNTINGVLVLEKHAVKAAGLNARTRRHQPDDDQGDDYLEKVKGELKHLSAILQEDISRRMITNEEEEIIEKTRVVLDFGQLLKEKKEQGVTEDIYAASTFPRFHKVAQDLKIPSLEFVPVEVLETQYRRFIHKLTNLVPDDVEKNKIDPREILSKLLSHKGQLFQDIQCILHIMGYCATKSSCESVLESYVSQYEYTIDMRKNFREDNANDCFEIVKNGPAISKCDRVVKTALKTFFNDKPLHFVTKKFFATSKVIERKSKETSQLVFMDEDSDNDTAQC